MGRLKNDGRGRLGGREKGTPNKATGDIKKWVSSLLVRNREQIEQDLEAMLPVERVRVLTGLIQYILPKKQAEPAPVEMGGTHLTINLRLS